MRANMGSNMDNLKVDLVMSALLCNTMHWCTIHWNKVMVIVLSLIALNGRMSKMVGWWGQAKYVKEFISSCQQLLFSFWMQDAMTRYTFLDGLTH